MSEFATLALRTDLTAEQRDFVGKIAAGNVNPGSTALTDLVAVVISRSECAPVPAGCRTDLDVAGLVDVLNPIDVILCPADCS